MPCSFDSPDFYLQGFFVTLKALYYMLNFNTNSDIIRTRTSIIVELEKTTDDTCIFVYCGNQSRMTKRITDKIYQELL